MIDLYGIDMKTHDKRKGEIMGKEMSDTSPEDMDRLVGESLLFYKDNEPIDMGLTLIQTAVIKDVLGIKDRDGKVCMYDDGHFAKFLVDADSPFGVFSKVECVQLLEGSWQRIPLSDVQVSVLVKLLGLRTDGQAVVGMSDEELLADYLPDKWSAVRRELLEVDKKLQAVKKGWYGIFLITGLLDSDRQRRCMGDIHASLLKAEKDVRFTGKRVKDMINCVEQDD